MLHEEKGERKKERKKRESDDGYETETVRLHLREVPSRIGKRI